MSTLLVLRLIAFFLVILASLVKPRWITSALAYLRRPFTTSGVISSIVDDLEELERKAHRLSARSSAGELFIPEDILQRIAKLRGLIRR